jgi:hypothetical protein
VRKLLVVFLTATAIALAADPFVGTWKIDIDKSHRSPGGPEVRQYERITLEPAGEQQYRETYGPVGSPGKAEIWVLDGKPHSTSDTDPSTFTQRFERIDSNHIRLTATGPKGTAQMDWAASADGKTLTVRTKGVGLTSGRLLSSVLVYNRDSGERKP